MSVRLEWTTAGLVSTRWLEPGERAADGNRPTYSGGALQIGPLVVEGTREELVDLLQQGIAALPPPRCELCDEPLGRVEALAGALVHESCEERLRDQQQMEDVR
jgi:hypothetical protein